MSELRDPTRLRDLDPLFDAVIERAHAHTPSARSIEAVVAAVERASAGVPVPSAHSGGFTGAPFGPASGSALLKSALLKLSVFAAMSSGVVWILNSGRAPLPAPQSQLASANATLPIAAPAELTASAAARAGGQAPPAAAPSTPTASATTPALAATMQPASAPSASTQAPAWEEPTRIEPSAPTAIESHPAATAVGGNPAAPSHVGAAHAWGSGVPASDGVARSVDQTPSRRSRARRASDDSEQSELDLLEQAQQALRDAPQLALALTVRHRQEYPQGAFVQEREQIAIEALFDLGTWQPCVRVPRVSARGTQSRRTLRASMPC